MCAGERRGHGEVDAHDTEVDTAEYFRAQSTQCTVGSLAVAARLQTALAAALWHPYQR